ncbi:diacylglycerol kinase family protein [Streptomyces sp. NPDC055005]
MRVTSGITLFVAVGGDGLVSLALRAHAASAAPLGVVAVGTGNDFARSLSLPATAAGAPCSRCSRRYTRGRISATRR